MKTLILNGSPRPHGDTAGLIERLRAQLEGDVLVVCAYDAGISPCVDCRRCWREPGCAIEDGMQAVYRFIEACDSAVIASPVYFSELTGRLLDVCSRLQTYYCGRAFRGEVAPIRPKRGAVILVGGGDGGMERAHATARTLLRQMNCETIPPLVASHATNIRPALSDAAALEGVDRIARFLNRAE